MSVENSKPGNVTLVQLSFRWSLFLAAASRQAWSFPRNPIFFLVTIITWVVVVVIVDRTFILWGIIWDIIAEIGFCYPLPKTRPFATRIPNKSSHRTNLAKHFVTHTVDNLVVQMIAIKFHYGFNMDKINSLHFCQKTTEIQGHWVISLEKTMCEKNWLLRFGRSQSTEFGYQIWAENIREISLKTVWRFRMMKKTTYIT